MTTSPPLSPSDLSPNSAPPPREPSPSKSRGWFAQFLLRLHFYAAIFVGPFILIAAASGALYAIAPQIEEVVYADQLHSPPAESSLPIADQVAAADAYIGTGETIVAVRPSPNPGDTTRVMYAADGLGDSQTRAIFVDPATAEIRGDLPVYGSSGSLPVRTWISELHRNLHLGEPGRLYSELAASWLGVIALAGLGLWIVRIRRLKKQKKASRPPQKVTGYRRTLALHSATGVWLLVGAVFLSATGITWSTYGGENVASLRAAFDVTTPSVDTALASGQPATGGEHAGHGSHGAETDAEAPASAPEPQQFDQVLAAAREVNVNADRVEIRPPATANTAWVVQEMQRSFPTEVDSVAVNGDTLEVTDRTDFATFSIPAKLSRWGIDTHMGSMFGLANQIVLFLVAAGIIAMIVWGYVMWWQRRPTRARVGTPPRRGALSRAPWWGVASVLVVAAAIGIFLPLLGVSLAAFVVVDLVIGYLDRRRERTPVGG